MKISTSFWNTLRMIARCGHARGAGAECWLPILADSYTLPQSSILQSKTNTTFNTPLDLDPRYETCLNHSQHSLKAGPYSCTWPLHTVEK